MQDENKKIIGIAHSRDELPLVLDALAAQDDGRDSVLVAWDGAVADATPAHVQVRLASEFALPDNVQKEAVLWIDHWSDAPLVGGRSFKESLVTGGTSLWWFFLPVLYPDIMRCMQYVDFYRSLYESENPIAVACVDKRSRPMLPFRLNRAADLPARVALMVADTMGLSTLAPVPSRRDQWSFWKTYTKRTTLDAFYSRLGWRLDASGRALLCRIARMVGVKGDTRGQTGKLVLFSTPVYWRREALSSTDPGGRDIIAGRVVDELVDGAGWEVVDVDTEVNIPNLEHYRRLWHKTRRNEVTCRPIEHYCDRRVHRSATAAAKGMQALWRDLRQDEDFKNSLTYRGVPLWRLLEHRLDYLFRDYARTAFMHIEAVDRVLSCERPDAVLIEYEEGSYGRAAVVAARRRGVPTVGLQHGLHGGAHIPSYYFRKTAWETGGDVTACPIPTKTAVFGDVTYEYLTRVSAYPAESVAVTGTTIYDDALVFGTGADPVEMRRALGCAEGSTVTVLSSIFTEAQDRVTFIETALGAIGDCGMQCIVKLHPRETETDWEATAERMGLDKPQVLRGRLWEAIAAADIVLSWYSSTIIDALLLRKPTVVLHLSGKNNPDDLASGGGVEIVDGRSELSAALGELVADSTRRACLVAQGEQLLSQHLHLWDGGARKRIAVLLAEVAAGATDRYSGIAGEEELVCGN